VRSRDAQSHSTPCATLGLWSARRHGPVAAFRRNCRRSAGSEMAGRASFYQRGGHILHVHEGYSRRSSGSNGGITLHQISRNSAGYNVTSAPLTAGICENTVIIALRLPPLLRRVQCSRECLQTLSGQGPIRASSEERQQWANRRPQPKNWLGSACPNNATTKLSSFEDIYRKFQFQNHNRCSRLEYFESSRHAQ